MAHAGGRHAELVYIARRAAVVIENVSQMVPVLGYVDIDAKLTCASRTDSSPIRVTDTNFTAAVTRLFDVWSRVHSTYRGTWYRVQYAHDDTMQAWQHALQL